MDSNFNTLGPALVIIFIIAIGLVIVGIIPYWKIYQRIGQSGALSLLQLIPLVNLIMLYILAYGDWPIEREAKRTQDELWQLKNSKS